MIDFYVKKLIKSIFGIFYHIHVIGAGNVPSFGPSIFISNHQSYLDAPLIYAIMKRDVKFLAYYTLFDIKFVGKVLKYHKDIPIKDKDIEEIKKAFSECCDILNNNELLCIFPEGNLTNNGQIRDFRAGIKHLWGQCPTPIIPVAISGFWDTIYSRKPWYKKIFQNPFKKKHLWINIGQPLHNNFQPDPEMLRLVVVALHTQIEQFKKSV